MHIPLAIAVLALLASRCCRRWILTTGSEVNARGLHGYWVRIARWAKG